MIRVNYDIRVGMIERDIGSDDSEYPAGSVYIYAVLKVKNFDSKDLQKRIPQQCCDVSEQGRLTFLICHLYSRKARLAVKTCQETAFYVCRYVLWACGMVSMM